MKLVDDRLQERLLDYLDGRIALEEDKEAKELRRFFERKRSKKQYHSNSNKVLDTAVE